MAGGIYTSEKCPECGHIYKDNKRNCLCCPFHPKNKASKFRVHYKGVKVRSASYKDASDILTHLRHDDLKGTFDPRDYKLNSPLGFKNLATEWLEIKSNEVSKSTQRSYELHINKAINHFEHTNVKDIRLKDFQLHIHKLKHLSKKTIHMNLSVLNQFFKWLYDNEYIPKIPKMPKIDFELAFRKTVNQDTQDAIIDEVARISYHIDPKIWLGIKMLSTYFNVRPHELINIKQKHIDLVNAEILIPHPKEKRPKYIFLLDEDVEIISQYPIDLPELYFFRHPPGKTNCKAGVKYGRDHLYWWWNRACKNLDIEDVPLYPGTRHSTVREMRHYHSPEEIRLASGHTTNKAFERYYTLDSIDMRKIYKKKGGKKIGKGGKKMGKIFSPFDKDK